MQQGNSRLKITGLQKDRRPYRLHRIGIRRFLILALAAMGRITFDGRGKLKTRPLGIYKKIFDAQGIKYT